MLYWFVLTDVQLPRSPWQVYRKVYAQCMTTHIGCVHKLRLST